MSTTPRTPLLSPMIKDFRNTISPLVYLPTSSLWCWIDRLLIISTSMGYPTLSASSVGCLARQTLSVLNIEPFSVEIGKEKTVDNLKDKMKEDQKHTFDGIDSGSFLLWKLFPPVPSVDDATLKLVRSPEDISGCIKLKPAERIQDHFPSPLEGHIHIIVQLPTHASPEETQASKKIRSGVDGSVRKWCVNGASSSVQVPYFSREETRKIFGMFAEDNYIHIDETVIDDIRAKSKGHPGMVCICGKVVSDNLKSLLDHQSKTIPYANWQRFPVSQQILAYNTFRIMVNFLKAPEARDAITLFRTVFAGFLGEVQLLDVEEDLADLLTSEGVLSRPSSRPQIYHVTSPLIDSLVRLKVIPAQFSSAPTISPLKFHPSSLIIPRVLQEALKCFDKELMQNARWRSYKVSTLLHQGDSHVQVPRESVYDTELMRIFCNWLKPYGWSVTGQWHSKTSEGRQYSDIVLENPNNTIVFELLATANGKSIEDHITKTPRYMSSLSAHEAWVILRRQFHSYLAILRST